MKDAFSQTLSDIPWSKIYESSNADVMFDMFVFLLSSALKKHAPFKNVFQKRKTPKLFKETWFDEEYKNLRERQLVYAKYSKISLPKKWSAYSKLRAKLSSVVKEKQKQFS